MDYLVPEVKINQSCLVRRDALIDSLDGSDETRFGSVRRTPIAGRSAWFTRVSSRPVFAGATETTHRTHMALLIDHGSPAHTGLLRLDS